MFKLPGGGKVSSKSTDNIWYSVKSNSLKFSASRFIQFSWSGTDIKQTAKTDPKVLGRNVSQHQTSCMLLCIISLLHAFHTFQWISGFFFVHTVVHQSTVRSVACKKLEYQKEVVVTYWEMLPVNSSVKSWMTDPQPHSRTRDFANWKRLCQSMDGVYSCCDRKDSEGKSYILTFWISEISHANSRCVLFPVFDHVIRMPLNESGELCHVSNCVTNLQNNGDY